MLHLRGKVIHGGSRELCFLSFLPDRYDLTAITVSFFKVDEALLTGDTESTIG